MESVFTFLFKYRPLLFQQGDFTFATPWPVLTVLVVAGLVAGGALATYAPPGGEASRRDRLVMGGLRFAALGVLTFCLFRPTLVLTSTVAQRNFVAVLVDDSRSMGLPGEDGRPRSAFVPEAFGPESDLVRGLEERFAVRFYRFAGDAARLDSVGHLGFDGTRTDLAGALDRVREDLSSVPLSGIVVLTDGADNGGRQLAEALVPLQAASVPVFSVGLGEEAIRPDIEVGRVEPPRTVLRGTSLLVDVVLAQRGMGGRTVPLVVEDDERLLAREEVVLDDDGQPTVARVRFTLDQPGPRRIRFRIPVQEGEGVEENNQRSVLIEVKDDREKILYFEGQPRWEVKFLRRAVQDDENLQVVLLQRTAENKFYRLDVSDSTELRGGFPRTREELFRYRALVLGSVEASFFTHDQLAMIADFVSQRGGGLLVLGGRDAYAEGGYAGTPVSEALPVVLEEPAGNLDRAFVELSVRPTPAGLVHVATQVRADSVQGPEAWDSLPPLSTVNRVTRVKAGATTLLTGQATDGTERVVMAYHRYGRGKVVALPVQDTWMWQMHADVPLDDQSHETMWRQLLRWLVDGVPEHVEGRLERESSERGRPVRITAEVRDSAYLGVNDAAVTARVSASDGTETLVPLDWTLERDGEYAGAFTPPADGDYAVRIETARGEATTGGDELLLRVEDGDDEYFDAGQRRPLLERVARETGGRYYTPATVGTLPEDVRYTGAGVTLTEERDLWDMPALFILLVMLVGAEWAFRRRRALV